MLTRRRFATGLAKGLALAGLTGPAAALRASGASRFVLPESRRRSLLAALAKADSRFDPFAKMLVVPADSGPGRHSALKSGDVHATQPSLVYAVALLDSGERWRVDRALEILRVVVGLQDRNPAGNTFGLWPYYLEEPLATMSSPDMDWADFCGVQLLMVWMLHRGRLSSELAGSVREAILTAAESIRRRNVSPNQTSVAITGTGVTLLAAQELKSVELRAYAKQRLRTLHERAMKHGSFAEYNSPTRLIITLRELARMLWLVKDARDLALIQPVHDLAWRHAAERFHAPSGQWAGPHSRTHQTNLRKSPATLAFLQAACSGKVELLPDNPLPLDLESCRLPLKCPRQWVQRFNILESPRQIVETFIPAEPARPGSQQSVVGTTWLHPRYTLGSVNRGDLWAERRPLLAYWGAARAPRYLRVRFLKDNRDFASALFFSAQHEGAVLAAVVFATDHGDAHPTLDPIHDGTIRASDLRLRFEFGGEGGELTAKAGGDQPKHLVIQDRDIRWIIRPVADAFGAEKFRWDFPELKLVNQIDAVAYQGEARAFKLGELGRAFAMFTVEEWPLEQAGLTPGSIEVSENASSAGASLSVRGKVLALQVPARPQQAAELFDRAVARVSNPNVNGRR